MNSKHNENYLLLKIHNEVLMEIIRNKLSKPFDNYQIIYSSGSEKGDGYLGVIYKIQILDKESNKTKLNLIVKLPPESLTRRKELSTNMFFGQESKFYNVIIPLYKKFQEKKGIDIKNDGFYHIPFCYKAMSEEPQEVIFMEDLKAIGFEMFDRLKEVRKDHVILVMKALAKMHALFMVLKDQHPELVESYIGLKDPFTIMFEKGDSAFNPWFEQSLSQALDVINKSDNKDMIDKINKLFTKKYAEVLTSCFDVEKIEPFGTLCHGDCWNNNMLFKYDKNGTPFDLRLIDFQIIRYASPVCDLMHYIFCCTTKPLRDKHYQEFLNVYYNNLSSFILKLGSDPEKLLPRKAFEDHLRLFGKFGLLMAIDALPIFTSDIDDVPDMDEIAENMKKYNESKQVNVNAFKFTTDKTFERYAERMIGVCDDMFALGYI